MQFGGSSLREGVAGTSVPHLTIPSSFKKRLDKKQKKSPQLVAAIVECVNRLGKDPSYPGLNAHRVKGTDGVWECYVDDANRVTWEWGDKGIILRNHCNHDIVKRNP